jgi:hypothetical protein
VLASVFWKKDGIFSIEYLEKGATIVIKYYVALLEKMKKQQVSKHRGKQEYCFFTMQPLCARNWQIFTLKF